MQGEATITERAPVKKELNGPEPLIYFSSLPIPVPRFISVTRTIPIAKIRIDKRVTTNGLCNWYPQPISSPAFLRETRVIAIAMNVAITPKTYALAFKLTDEFESAELFTRDKAFKAMTGKTQGMRLRIRPPMKAKRIAVNSDIPTSASNVELPTFCIS